MQTGRLPAGSVALAAYLICIPAVAWANPIAIGGTEGVADKLVHLLCLGLTISLELAVWKRGFKGIRELAPGFRLRMALINLATFFLLSFFLMAVYVPSEGFGDRFLGLAGLGEMIVTLLEALGATMLLGGHSRTVGEIAGEKIRCVLVSFLANAASLVAYPLIYGMFQILFGLFLAVVASLGG